MADKLTPRDVGLLSAKEAGAELGLNSFEFNYIRNNVPHIVIGAGTGNSNSEPRRLYIKKELHTVSQELLNFAKDEFRRNLAVGHTKSRATRVENFRKAREEKKNG